MVQKPIATGDGRAGCARVGRAAGVTAVLAALLATGGDLVLLWVANAARPEYAALPRPSDGLLLAGHLLGALAIPLYGLGYWHVARGLAPAGATAARAVLLLGAYGGALGGAVHGMTGLILRSERLAGVAGAEPLAVVARYGAYLLPLWVLLGVLSLAGSAVYATAVLRGGTAFPRWMAAANPLVLVLALSAVAAPSAWLRAFLLPAAPNLAHLVFFALATAVRW